jgi:murein DD-endopeptidase MepM/ murein hydrolase activator NlpD
MPARFHFLLVAAALALVAQGPVHAHGAVGGPQLQAQSCADAEVDRDADADAGIAPAGIAALRRQLDCLDAGIDQPEVHAVSQSATRAAPPGRLPGYLPVANARLGSAFGNRLDPFNRHLRFHAGIDLAARSGTPILSTAGGRVIFSGHKPGYGNVVEIDHGNALVTRYGHASRLIAREGDRVLPRQHIADVGSTGRSTGPHLHFEVLRDGRPVDPGDYLRAVGDNPRHPPA